jgi:hypothetical protein
MLRIMNDDVNAVVTKILGWTVDVMMTQNEGLNSTSGNRTYF